MSKRKVSIEESKYYLSAWGNENIIRNYVSYFEMKAEEEVSSIKMKYPNYAAWIRLYTELICNSLYWRLFRNEGDKNIFKKGYGAIRDAIIKKIEQEIVSSSERITQDKINQMKKSINLILNLRHSFLHGGLPNLMRDLWYDSDQDDFINMLNPNNYKETREIFLNAEKLLKLLPQPTIIVTT